MMFTETVLLPKEKLEYFQNLLAGTIDWPARPSSSAPDIIYAAYAEFGDGWELDVNIVQGFDKPFVDAILFHDGSECYGWDITDSILGEWQVVLGDDINRAFKLEIRAEE